MLAIQLLGSLVGRVSVELALYSSLISGTDLSLLLTTTEAMSKK
jgi:hypothetical protein